jgi:hypothetical protein
MKMDPETKWMVFFGVTTSCTIISVVAILAFASIRVAEIKAGQRMEVPK